MSPLPEQTPASTSNTIVLRAVTPGSRVILRGFYFTVERVEKLPPLHPDDRRVRLYFKEGGETYTGHEDQRVFR